MEVRIDDLDRQIARMDHCSFAGEPFHLLSRAVSEKSINIRKTTAPSTHDSILNTGAVYVKD